MFEGGGEVTELSLQSLLRAEDPTEPTFGSRPPNSSKVQSVLDQLIQIDSETSAYDGGPVKR